MKKYISKHYYASIIFIPALLLFGLFSLDWFGEKKEVVQENTNTSMLTLGDKRGDGSLANPSGTIQFGFNGSFHSTPEPFENYNVPTELYDFLISKSHVQMLRYPGGTTSNYWNWTNRGTPNSNNSTAFPLKSGWSTSTHNWMNGDVDGNGVSEENISGEIRTDIIPWLSDARFHKTLDNVPYTLENYFKAVNGQVGNQTINPNFKAIKPIFSVNVVTPLGDFIYSDNDPLHKRYQKVANSENGVGNYEYDSDLVYARNEWNSLIPSPSNDFSKNLRVELGNEINLGKIPLSPYKIRLKDNALSFSGNAIAAGNYVMLSLENPITGIPGIHLTSPTSSEDIEISMILGGTNGKWYQSPSESVSETTTTTMAFSNNNWTKLNDSGDEFPLIWGELSNGLPNELITETPITSNPGFGKTNYIGVDWVDNGTPTGENLLGMTFDFVGFIITNNPTISNGNFLTINNIGNGSNSINFENTNDNIDTHEFNNSKIREIQDSQNGKVKIMAYVQPADGLGNPNTYRTERYPYAETYATEALRYTRAIKKKFGDDAKVGVCVHHKQSTNGSRTVDWNKDMVSFNDENFCGISSNCEKYDAFILHPYPAIESNNDDNDHIINALPTTFWTEFEKSFEDFIIPDDKEIWITEFNLERSDAGKDRYNGAVDENDNAIIGVKNTGVHALFISRMMESFLEKDQVTIALMHNIFSENLGFSSCALPTKIDYAIPNTDKLSHTLPGIVLSMYALANRQATSIEDVKYDNGGSIAGWNFKRQVQGKTTTRTIIPNYTDNDIYINTGMLNIPTSSIDDIPNIQVVSFDIDNQRYTYNPNHFWETGNDIILGEVFKLPPHSIALITGSSKPSGDLIKLIPDVSAATTYCFGENCDLLFIQRQVNSLNTTATNLQISPNPNNGNFSIEITAENKGKGKIEILDTQGQLIQTEEYTIKKGKQTRNINLRNAIPGIYIVRMTIGNKVTSKKIIVH